MVRDAKGRFSRRGLYTARLAVEVVRGKYWSSLVESKSTDLVWC